MTDWTGKQLGAFQVVEEIGRGGMAVVYKAYQPSLNRYVAIKLLRGYLSEEKALRERFLREARAAATLQHPNIIRIYDVGREGDLNFFVMDYVAGPSLEAKLQAEGALDVPRALSIVREVGSALDYAHSQGVVHRDVKPSNILLTSDGQAILSDFGIAKAAAESRLTQTGTVVGTPEYMSPEQAEGPTVDSRSDLYSLGVVLYEMLTGRVPFEADTPLAVLYKHVHEPPPSPSSLHPGISRDVEKVVLHALAKDRAKRYQSAGGMANALSAALASSGPSRGGIGPVDLSAQASTAQSLLARIQARLRGGRGGPDEVDRLFDQGLAAYRRREWVRAQGLLGQVVQRQPDYDRNGRAASDLLQNAQRNASLDQRSKRPVLGGGPMEWVAAFLLVALVVVIAVVLRAYRQTVVDQTAAEATAQAQGTLQVQKTGTAAAHQTAGARATGTVRAHLTETEQARQTAIADATASSHAQETVQLLATGTAQAGLTATAEHLQTQTVVPSHLPDPKGRILFASGDAEGISLYVIDVASGQVRPLVELGNFSLDMVTKSNAPQYAWLDGGRRIAYVYGPVNFSDELYLVDEHGGNRVNLGGANGIGALAASPNGRQLLYVAGECLKKQEQWTFGFFGSWYSEECVHWVHRIHGIDIADLSRRVLRENLSGEQYRGISWSPDGKQLAIISNGGVQGNHRLWVMNADGSDQRLLAPGSGDHQSPAWSPDGGLIAFSSNREGNYEIYTIEPDGANLRPVTASRFSDFAPSWSPDGNWLAFCSDRDGTFGIWIIDREGKHLRRVVSQHSMWPVWGE